MSLTLKFFPNWVLVPKACASIVSYLSRAKPETADMVKSATVAILIFSRLDMMFTFSSDCAGFHGDWSRSGRLPATQATDSNLDSNLWIKVPRLSIEGY